MQGSERLSNLPKVTQVNDGVRVLHLRSVFEGREKRTNKFKEENKDTENRLKNMKYSAPH